MTIEATLVRIAVALELLNESRGLVQAVASSGTGILKAVQTELSLPPADDDDLSEFDDDEDDDLDEDDTPDSNSDEPEAPPKKKRGRPAKAKPVKNTTKTTTVGSPDKGSDIDADTVRGKLKDLQLKSGSAAEPKSVLKSFGASTFGQLPESKYAAAIAVVDKKLAEWS